MKDSLLFGYVHYDILQVYTRTGIQWTNSSWRHSQYMYVIKILPKKRVWNIQNRAVENKTFCLSIHKQVTSSCIYRN